MKLSARKLLATGAVVALGAIGGAATVGTLVATAAAEEPAAEPAWWERCEELPSNQIEHCFYEHNGEVEPGDRRPTPPDAPIRKRIHERYPQARSIFINCPGNNRLGDDARVCEFRLIDRRRVVKGIAIVEAESESWSHTAWWLTGFYPQAPAPKHWRRCGVQRHSRASPEPVRLSAYGTTCPEARELALRIGDFDVSPYTLRLPRHFSEGEWQTNTLGFIVSRYRCRGNVQVRQGNPNPYGHETASCRTRFGDRLVYVFNRGS
jgi:hypothetical protein